uniref:DUF547 domain-containing protein n=1 Tax=Hanusia phi TaxID=3032 RepID=A0A7S0EGC4_9CRYP
MQKLVLDMFDKYLSDDGRGIRYESLARSRGFKEYVLQASNLRREGLLEDIASLAADERMAVFLNLYNSMVVHGTLAVPPGPSAADARGPFFSGKSGVNYNIGGQHFSLDDIEHAVLRGSPEWDARSFKKNDPRRIVTIPRSQFDPRIHFALNCGAKSCPPIKLYSADNLDKGLALATQAFCESEVQVDLLARSVRLSKILFWYCRDFSGKEEVDNIAMLRKLTLLLPPEIEPAVSLLRLLEAADAGEEVSVLFSEYDWSRNEEQS